MRIHKLNAEEAQESVETVEAAQSTFCEFLVRCLERLSDLLAAPFEEGVVCARCFEPAEVLADLVEGTRPLGYFG